MDQIRKTLYNVEVIQIFQHIYFEIVYSFSFDLHFVYHYVNYMIKYIIEAKLTCIISSDQ